VHAALLDIGEDESRYEQFLHWGLEAVKDFHMDQARSIKTKRIEMTPYKTADLPMDMVDLVNVGIQNADRLYIFRQDSSLIFRKKADTIVPEPSIVQPISSLSWVDNYYISNYTNDRGEFIGRMFGCLVGNDHEGYYRINEDCTEIQFNADVVSKDDKVYVEYISDGFDATEETMVDTRASKLIKLYIHWQKAEYSRSSTAEKERARQLYYNEMAMVQRRMLPFTLEDIREVLERRYTQSPKLI
jgi:hypothetical protein